VSRNAPIKTKILRGLPRLLKINAASSRSFSASSSFAAMLRMRRAMNFVAPFFFSGLLIATGSKIVAATNDLSQGTNSEGPAVTGSQAQVVIVQDDQALEAFEPNPDRIRAMVDRGITRLTGKSSVASAWSSLVSTQDVVGLKVLSAAGPNSGTRPAVVAAVVQGLLAAGVPPKNIILWDKHQTDLRLAGFFDLAKRFNVRVAGSFEAGYDETNYYDKPLIGNLVWGDFEFGKKGEGIGRKSFVSKLVSQEMTRIINISPLLNHNEAGVCGNLYSLAMGSVDNTIRFESSPDRLAKAVPEIYALRAVGDKVVLNIVDGLICQYEGSERGLLHYSTELNQIRFSRDPVALDMLSIQELDRQRRLAKMPDITPDLELYDNAAVLELGVNDFKRIHVENIRPDRGR
jgi:uncharacterized protein DUF362